MRLLVRCATAGRLSSVAVPRAQPYAMLLRQAQAACGSSLPSPAGRCAALAYDSVAPSSHVGLPQLNAPPAYAAPYGVGISQADAGSELERRLVWGLTECASAVLSDPAPRICPADHPLLSRLPLAPGPTRPPGCGTRSPPTASSPTGKPSAAMASRLALSSPLGRLMNQGNSSRILQLEQQWLVANGVGPSRCGPAGLSPLAAAGASSLSLLPPGVPAKIRSTWDRGSSPAAPTPLRFSPLASPRTHTDAPFTPPSLQRPARRGGCHLHVWLLPGAGARPRARVLLPVQHAAWRTSVRLRDLAAPGVAMVLPTLLRDAPPQPLAGTVFHAGGRCWWAVSSPVPGLG